MSRLVIIPTFDISFVFATAVASLTAATCSHLLAKWLRVPVDKMLQSEWKKYCIRPDRVIDTIKQEHSLFIVNQKLRKQVMESQKLVADQLLGVSRV